MRPALVLLSLYMTLEFCQITAVARQPIMMVAIPIVNKPQPNASHSMCHLQMFQPMPARHNECDVSDVKQYLIIVEEPLNNCKGCCQVTIGLS